MNPEVLASQGDLKNKNTRNNTVTWLRDRFFIL
jgi:hypothetical protein